MTEGSYVEQQLRKYGNAASLTEGISMRPFLKSKRDSVVLEAVDSPLRKYDVVLYPCGGKLIMHRIVGFRKDGSLIIRGDNTYKREIVPREKIIARLTSFTRKGKSGTVNDLGYKVYSVVWTFIYPLRFIINRPLNLFYRAVRRIFRTLRRK